MWQGFGAAGFKDKKQKITISSAKYLGDDPGTTTQEGTTAACNCSWAQN